MKKAILVAAALAALGAGVWFWLDSRPGRPKPALSYLVIVVDSLRADHMSAYGYERETTPVLDAISADGLRFEQPLAQAPWTKPSVASIFTGTYSGVHRVLSAKTVVDGKPLTDSLSSKFVTLAEAVKQAGLATAGFGMKLHLRAQYGFDQGFDAYDMEVGDAAAINGALVRWLKRRDPERFFVYLHYNDPHYPYSPGEEWGRFGTVEPTIQINGDTKRAIQGGTMELTEEHAQELRDAYDGEILYNDHEIGRLLEAIRHRGYSNVLVIFTADHGEEFLDHGDITHGQSLYAELLRVPMILGGSGLPDAARGTVRPEPVQTIDVYNTILDLEGLPVPPFVQGRSFAPLLRGEPWTPAEAYSQRPLEDTVVDASGRYKLIRYLETGETRLFDLLEDPGELRPLVEGHDERIAELTALLDAWAADSLALFETVQPQDLAPLDPEIEERLRSIGYVD